MRLEGNNVIDQKDELRLERNLSIYDQISSEMMKDGVPKDKEDRQFLLDALNGSSRVLLGKAKIKSDAKAMDMQKQAAEIAAQIMSRSGRRHITTDVEDAVIVAREIPMLPASIPRVETVADETFVGVQNLRFEDFEKDI